MDCINQMEARTIAKERQRAVKILLEAPAKMTLSDIAALIWGPFQSSEKR
jgi:hypothetical protein